MGGGGDWQLEEAFVQNVRPGVVLMISLCDLFVWFLQNYHLKQHANENKTKNEVSSIGLLYGKVVHGEEKNCDWFPERSEFLLYAPSILPRPFKKSPKLLHN